MAVRLLGGASMSPDSDKSDKMQGILKSLQTMIGMLVQKVCDIENKYEELREIAMDEYVVNVCEDSMITAPGIGEEDACSSVSARGLGTDAHTSWADRASTDDNQKCRWLHQGQQQEHTQRHRLYQRK